MPSTTSGVRIRSVNGSFQPVNDSKFNDSAIPFGITDSNKENDSIGKTSSMNTPSSASFDRQFLSSLLDNGLDTGVPNSAIDAWVKDPQHFDMDCVRGTGIFDPFSLDPPIPATYGSQERHLSFNFCNNDRELGYYFDAFSVDASNVGTFHRPSWVETVLDAYSPPRTWSMNSVSPPLPGISRPDTYSYPSPSSNWNAASSTSKPLNKMPRLHSWLSSSPVHSKVPLPKLSCTTSSTPSSPRLSPRLLKGLSRLHSVAPSPLDIDLLKLGNSEPVVGGVVVEQVYEEDCDLADSFEISPLSNAAAGTKHGSGLSVLPIAERKPVTALDLLNDIQAGKYMTLAARPQPTENSLVTVEENTTTGPLDHDEAFSDDGGCGGATPDFVDSRILSHHDCEACEFSDGGQDFSDMSCDSIALRTPSTPVFYSISLPPSSTSLCFKDAPWMPCLEGATLP